MTSVADEKHPSGVSWLACPRPTGRRSRRGSTFPGSRRREGVQKDHIAGALAYPLEVVWKEAQAFRAVTPADTHE